MELHHVVSRAPSSRWCFFASSIFLFSQFTLIPCYSSSSPCISSIVLWFGSVYSRFKKINKLNLRSTLVLAFLWFKFYRSTLESCFCVDFRFYHFSVIIFLCWTIRYKLSSKILIRKKHKNLSVNHLIHVVLESCLVIVIITLCSKFVLNFYFVDWILDTFVHVFLSFLA